MPEIKVEKVHVKSVAGFRTVGHVSKDGRTRRVLVFLSKEDGTHEQMVMSSDHAEQFALNVLKEVAKTRAVSELIRGK